MMKAAIVTRSDSFRRHIRKILAKPPVISDRFPSCRSEEDLICLVHQSSMDAAAQRVQLLATQCRLVVAVDQPDLADMLKWIRAGVAGYCNSYMNAANYRQMLGGVNQGSVWFPPDLQNHAFELAARALPGEDAPLSLQGLTEREIEIARSVAEGLPNREIGLRLGITERTVKSHLTQIYRKLGIKDRMALALRLNAA